jgi:hypothetical protein
MPNNKKKPRRRRVNTPPKQPVSLKKRIINWLAAANKLVLGAVAVGIAAVITGAVEGLPHLLVSTVAGTPPALTIVQSPSLASSDPGDPCAMNGSYALARPPHAPRVASTQQLSSLVAGAPDENETDGTFTLQAAPGQTVVVTAIHTVVVTRVPVPSESLVDIMSGCGGAGSTQFSLLQTYQLTVNLDASDVAPTITQLNTPAPSSPKAAQGLQVVVTNSSPVLLDSAAVTSKYDVRWKLLVDYNVNGQSETAFIQNGSQPFHTVGRRSGDPSLDYLLNADETAWNLQPS